MNYSLLKGIVYLMLYTSCKDLHVAIIFNLVTRALPAPVFD